MDFGDLIAGDFDLVMDNIEPITLFMSTQNRNVSESVVLQKANRSPMTRSSRAYWEMEIEDDDISFTFQAADFLPTLNPPEIHQHDTITDAAGNVYNVQSSRLMVFQTVWNVLCRRKT